MAYAFCSRGSVSHALPYHTQLHKLKPYCMSEAAVESVKETSIDLILEKIDETLDCKAGLFQSLGIKNGLTGLAVYQFAQYLCHRQQHHYNNGMSLIEKAFELLNQDYVSDKLFLEMAELGIAIIILQSNEVCEMDAEEVLQAFDEILSTHLDDCLHQKNFDPVIGGLSYGYYFLARSHTSPFATQKVADTVSAILQNRHYDSENHVYWKSKLFENDPVYVGISHGILGINLFLMNAAGNNKETIETVRSSCKYVQNTLLANGPVFFPVVHNKENGSDTYANNWCYGDPGTLYALFTCAQYLQDESLQQFCLEKLRACVTRERNDTYLIAGYGLVYGYAGLCMLYSRLYELTGEDFLLKAKKKMIANILNSFNEADEYLGYAGYWNQETAITNYSFSEGLIGIALVLMAERNPLIKQLYHPFYFVQ